VCKQLDKESWKFTCKFLCHPEDQTSSAFCVKIPGFSQKLLLCQAYCLVRTLVIHNTNVHSCFHRHAMGIGKTTIAIAAHHVQHIINIMHNDILEVPLLHAGAADNSDTACPSNEQVVKKYGFDCPCASLFEPISF
jgi:hypothetical protein